MSADRETVSHSEVENHTIPLVCPAREDTPGSGDEPCDKFLGCQFLTNWRAHRAEYCGSTSNMQGSQSIMSKVTCAVLHDADVGERESCVFENVLLDFSKTAVMKNQRRLRSGFLLARCSESRPLPKNCMYRFPNVVKISPNTELECDRWEESPTMLVSHDDVGNTYHNLADFWTMFLALQVHEEQNLSDWKVVNMDSRIMCFTESVDGEKLAGPDIDCEGPYFSQYYAWFGKGIVRAKDYGQEKICFKKLMFNSHVSKNAIWSDFWKDSPCLKNYNAEKGSSPIYRDYGHAVVSNFGAMPNADNKIVITYSIRHKKPFQTAPTYDRTAANREELLSILRALAKEYSAIFETKVVLDAVDFATISFPEQVSRTARTSILVGFHGAGLTQILFASRPAALVELFPYNRKEKGIKNMAVLAGYGYFSWTNGNISSETKQGTIVDIEAVENEVRKALVFVGLGKGYRTGVSP